MILILSSWRKGSCPPALPHQGHPFLVLLEVTSSAGCHSWPFDQLMPLHKKTLVFSLLVLPAQCGDWQPSPLAHVHSLLSIRMAVFLAFEVSPWNLCAGLQDYNSEREWDSPMLLDAVSLVPLPLSKTSMPCQPDVACGGLSGLVHSTVTSLFWVS